MSVVPASAPQVQVKQVNNAMNKGYKKLTATDFLKEAEEEQMELLDGEQIMFFGRLSQMPEATMVDPTDIEGRRKIRNPDFLLPDGSTWTKNPNTAKFHEYINDPYSYDAIVITDQRVVIKHVLTIANVAMAFSSAWCGLKTSAAYSVTRVRNTSEAVYQTYDLKDCMIDVHEEITKSGVARNLQEAQQQVASVDNAALSEAGFATITARLAFTKKVADIQPTWDFDAHVKTSYKLETIFGVTDKDRANALRNALLQNKMLYQPSQPAAQSIHIAAGGGAADTLAKIGKGVMGGAMMLMDKAKGKK